jgi:hypothetical protein
MIVAPSSRWRAWTAERFAGSNGRPASTPIGTEDHGGRAVVVPTVSRSVPVPCAISRTDGSWHMRPWQGPIVTVV